jgi:hypothetical protein
MAVSVAFTLAEAATVLDPPMTEQQLRLVVRALGWQPAGKRYTGRRGHPEVTYDAGQIMGLHAALVPFIGPGRDNG